MKIKIPAYPNYSITERAFKEDIVANSETINDGKKLKNELLMVVEFINGEKRVIKARPIEYLGNLYVTSFPNPVHLFLSVAIEHYNQSEKIKATNFPSCGKKVDDNLYLLDIAEDGTHECYNSYIKYRVSSIVMIVSALEAFLNHVIANDFIYEQEKDGKFFKLNKKKIESTNVSFREKVTRLIPQYLKTQNFWDDINEELISILNLYENRRSIIHLKTNAEDDFHRYFKAIDKMLDFDLLFSINSTMTFMNKVSNNFIQVDN